MKEKDREPAESASRRQETGDRETGRGRGPEDPTAAWDPDRTLPAPADARGPVPPAPASELGPGDTFGSYRLEALLGRGGFGEVWEAVHSESGRRVALKLLTSQGETTPEARERFHREARLAASVSHPHCVFLFGAEEVDGRMAVAMEIMEGGTLQDVLDAEGRLPYRRAVDAVLDLVDGLEAAEKKGIIHRDIKPSNCFLDASGGVKIGDFGLSKTLEADEALTVTGTYLGTPAYSSPEQVRGREIDFRSDVFSLGALLYHLVAGERPFGSGPATHVLGRILFEDPKPPSEHDVEVPKGLEKVIRRMMGKEPERRFQSYDAVRRALIPFSSQALTPAALPKRFVAFLVDWLVLFAPGMVLGAFQGARQGAIEASGNEWEAGNSEILGVLDPVLFLLYFSLLECLWGASLGKQLLGLRVREADGARAGRLRVFVRTSLFVAVLFAHRLAPEGPGALEVLPLIFLAAIFATMRKRNWYAGLHELLSGTRVTRSPRNRHGVLDGVEDAREGISQDVGELRFGPFQVVRREWVREREALYDALDPLLNRRVWVHVVDGGEGRPETYEAPLRGGTRSAHLHWLQRGAERDRRWSAYERPPGSPLLAWTEERPSAGWQDGLIVLRYLAGVLAEEGATERWSLSHIWVEPGGRVRLLPFMWDPESVREADQATRGRDWQALLQSSAGVLLEGVVPSDSARALRAPMPRSVGRVLDRIATRDTQTVEDARRELENLEREVQALSGLRRAAAVLPVAVVLSVFGAAIAAGATAQFGSHAHPPDPYYEIPARLTQWHDLANGGQPEIERLREALASLLAHGYIQATSSREALEEEQAESEAEGLGHQLVVRSVNFMVSFILHGSVSRPKGAPGLPWGVSQAEAELLSELAEERGKLGTDKVFELQRTAGPTLTGLWIVLAVLAGLEFLVAALGIFLAGLLRGGLGLRLALIHVQRHDGRTAGRVRCVARASVAWLPAMVPQIALWVLGPQHPLPGLLATAVLIVLLIGAAYAVWHPTRGIQDRLAGTWLMPR